MPNVAQFLSVLSAEGQDATYHRESGGDPCPCLTPEGFPDMKWHEDNPAEPMHNEQGKINVVVINVPVKGFIQPIQSTRATRLSGEYIFAVFGEVQADDHLGIFPLEWGTTTLDFYDWSQVGEDFIMYDGRRFLVVNANKIPDPSGGDFHHWEVGMRLIKTERPEVPV